MILIDRLRTARPELETHTCHASKVAVSLLPRVRRTQWLAFQLDFVVCREVESSRERVVRIASLCSIKAAKQEARRLEGGTGSGGACFLNLFRQEGSVAQPSLPVSAVDAVAGLAACTVSCPAGETGLPRLLSGFMFQTFNSTEQSSASKRRDVAVVFGGIT